MNSSHQQTSNDLPLHTVTTQLVDTALSSSPFDRSPPPLFVTDQNGRKFVRSACKARQVSPDHDSESAYLLIPEDAPHGYFMICSHAVCAKTGRRFRYCAVCRRAVTRRNFHKRHDHGLIRYDECGSPILPPTTVFSLAMPANPGADPSSFCQQTTLLNPQKRPRPNSYMQAERKKGPATVRGTSQQPTKEREFVSSSSNEVLKPRVLRKEEQAWFHLFRKRPRLVSPDRTAVAGWLTSLRDASYPKLHDERKKSGTTPPTRATNKGEYADELMTEIDFVLGEDLDISNSYSKLFKEQQQARPTSKTTNQIDSSDEQIMAEIDAALGDFDQDLDSYKGDWSLS